MNSIYVQKKICTDSFLAGFKAEQFVSRAELKQTCCQWHDTDPAPDDVLTDDLVTDKHQAQ